MQTIKVEVRSVYGQDKIYPVCETAKRFADLCGTKTLSPSDLRIIESLGYQIVQAHRATLAAMTV